MTDFIDALAFELREVFSNDSRIEFENNGISIFVYINNSYIGHISLAGLVVSGSRIKYFDLNDPEVDIIKYITNEIYNHPKGIIDERISRNTRQS